MAKNSKNGIKDRKRGKIGVENRGEKTSKIPKSREKNTNNFTHTKKKKKMAKKSTKMKKIKVKNL